MRSRTSFFEPTLFKKTVLRFWPIWFFYAAVWIVALPVQLGGQIGRALARSDMDWLLIEALEFLPFSQAGNFAAVLCGLFCCVSAMAVFSHLYFPRAASAYGALPVRREGVFLSVALAGLLPLLAVNLLVFLIALLVEVAFGVLLAGPLLTWLAVVSMQTLAFFGFAALCAQLTGSIIVLPLVYAVLNFTFPVVEAAGRALMNFFVFGFSGNSLRLYVLSPLLGAVTSLSTRGVYEPAAEGGMQLLGYSFSGWGYAAAYAVTGLLMLAGALLLYKRRRLETAGDVVAVHCLKPVFKYCLSGGCALCLGTLLFLLFFSDRIRFGVMSSALLLLMLMLIGAFIGYFAAEMLIRKSFRVFHDGRRWIGLGVVCALCAALVLFVELDLSGYERRRPAAAEIESVSLSVGGDRMELREAENIEALLALHARIIENKAAHEANGNAEAGLFVELKPDEPYFYTSLDICYRLKDGGTLERYYPLRGLDTTGDIRLLQTLVNCPEALLSRTATDFPITVENIDYADVSYGALREETGAEWLNLSLTREEANELYYSCILPDLRDGLLGQLWLLTDTTYSNTVYDCHIYISCTEREPRGGNYYYQDFTVCPTIHSARTNDWLRAHGVELFTQAETSMVQEYAVDTAVG